jgi:hypothetical protein
VAVNTETLRLAADLRIRLAEITDQHTRDLVKTWAQAWDDLREELELAAVDLAGVDPDHWPTQVQIARHARIQRAMAAVEARLRELAEDTAATVVTDIGDTVAVASAAQPRLIASQLPIEAGGTAVIASQFDRVSPGALDAIVERSTQQVTARTRPLSAEATAAMKRALIRGVALGDNPRITAARIVGQLEGRFNGGLTRALVIARTEILDAHRAGAAVQQRANSDVLAGWLWHAQLNRRTCPSCWAKHGEFHTLDEPGPDDHHQGRCTRTPVTKSWRELGFDVPEPPSVMPDARAVFRAMPHADQVAVMCERRLAALNSGAAKWADLSQRRSTTGWRDSYAPTPVRDLTNA